jgi:CheY-like chemotaxis protein
MFEAELKGKTVLVIDDHPVAREVIGDLFEHLGCAVFSTADGVIGAQLADETLPDAIVSDFRIRGSDALDVLRRVRSNPRTARIPVVIMSFEPSPDLPEQCLQGGASAFIRKDLGSAPLVAAVARALQEA